MGSLLAGFTTRGRAFTAAGWRVVTLTAAMPLGAAWEVLNHSCQARTQPATPAPAVSPPLAARPSATATP
jgi:hypothetical protein